MTDALATRPQGTTAVQTFSPMEGYDASDVRGKEGITGDMLRLSYLAAAQKSSKAIDPTDDAYIEGLKFGDLYDAEDTQVYGRGPLNFQTLRLRKRAYIPDEDGRIGEEVEWDDPRCTDWDTPTGKPLAMQVIDAIVIIEGEMFPKIISFKSASMKAGQTLAKFLTMVQGPSFIALFNLSTQLVDGDKGKFAKLVVKTSGKPSIEAVKFAEKLYESIKDAKIAVPDAGDEEGGDTPTSRAQQAGGTAKKNDDIPF